jgi:hypothetical protein
MTNVKAEMDELKGRNEAAYYDTQVEFVEKRDEGNAAWNTRATMK